MLFPSSASYTVCLNLKVISAWCVVFTLVDFLVSQYIEGLKSTQMLTRCGSALALGCLPRFMIHSKLKQVCLEDVYIFLPFCFSLHHYLGIRCCVFVCVRSSKASSRCAPSVRRRGVSQRRGEMQSEQLLSEYPYIFLFYLVGPGLCLKSPSLSLLFFVLPVC